jgi:hypothetical protein
MHAMRKIKRASAARSRNLQQCRKVFGRVARCAAAEFNRTARALMDNLQVVFPDDARVRDRIAELQIVDERSCLPATLFFRTMQSSVGSGLGGAPAGASGGAAPIRDERTLGDLVAARDERLFAHESIAAVLGGGAEEHWRSLDAANRDAVWTYLDLLIATSSRVFVAENARNSDGMDGLFAAVEAAMERSGGSTGGAAATAAVHDPGVANAARQVLAGMGIAPDCVETIIAKAFADKR